MTGLLDGLHGGFELRPTVAAQRTEGVTGEALGVNPDQWGALGKVANIEDAVFLVGGRISESLDSEFTEFRREKGFRLRLE